MRAEFEKLNINKFINVLTSLNDLKTKADDLDVGKLKNFPVELKKLSNVVDHKITKNT